VSIVYQGALLGLSAAASPGPFQAYLLAQSLRSGAPRTLPVALVPLVSDPPVIVATLVALSSLPARLLDGLELASAAVVLWLAATTLRALWRPPPAREREPPRGFLRAALLNFTNPNAWIFWSAVGGPVLAGAWRRAPLEAAAFLAGFYLLLTCGNAALVLLAGNARRLGHGLDRGLGAVSGLALLAFGAWQLARGLSALG
jgi:threonine/homoserine/homoserine lactone efflux protein